MCYLVPHLDQKRCPGVSLRWHYDISGSQENMGIWSEQQRLVILRCDLSPWGPEAPTGRTICFDESNFHFCTATLKLFNAVEYNMNIKCSESRIDWFLIRRPPPKQKRVINLHQNGNQPDKKDEGWKSLHEKLNYKNLLNSAHLFDIYFSAIPFFITRYHMPVQEPVDKSLLILNRVSREAGKPSKTNMQFFLTLFKGGGI